MNIYLFRHYPHDLRLLRYQINLIFLLLSSIVVLEIEPVIDLSDFVEQI